MPGNQVSSGEFPRLSIGMLTLPSSLAYAELFLTVAGVFRRFDMELHETTVDDVRLVRDRFFGASRDGSMGVRASISGTVNN